jgi:ATP-dependent DNA helicase RecQ
MLPSSTPSITDAETLLRSRYGYPQFRGLQANIIAHTLNGGDSLVLMPTGGGKSICYQIPALLRDGVGIVVSPLIALMQDQVDALHRIGVRAAYLNSTQFPAQRANVIATLQSAELDLLYIAPERLLLPETLQLLSTCNLALIAIDEAHCVSQWGHDFRKDYLGLHVLAEHFPGIPRMALTATADQRTRQEIVRRLKLHEPAWFVAGFDRPNIHYTVQPKTDPSRQLQTFLANHANEAGIIYCQSRARVLQVAEHLRVSGRNALPYHAGLAADIRRRNQERFLRDDGVIMVATIAFGMGIDKPDVRFVVHLDLPKSMEAYYQETGRAGRDGLPADAWMIYGMQDVVRLRQMVDQGEAEEAQKRIERNKLDTLLGWCETVTCRRRALLATFDDDPGQDCGYCDNCEIRPATWDATEPAQKLLSCIYRTGQRFGAGHVLDVLLGRSTAKTTQFRHEGLSTFGIGKDIPEARWRSILRQLTVRGLVTVDADRFGALRLHSTSRALLRGEEQLILREDPASRGKKTAKPKASAAERDLPDEALSLWHALRALRKRIAEEEKVPPYVIFHDSTLLGMIERHPRTAGEMLEVNGVGQKRLERYGQLFLAVIVDHEL